jgi:hypothetical protein
VVRRGEKPSGRRGDWKEERFAPYSLGCLQKNENEEECSDIEKSEGSGDSKSQTPIERGGGNRKNGRDSRRPWHGPQQGTELVIE